MNKLKIFFFFLAIKICSFHQFEQILGSRNTDSDECILQNINNCPAKKFTAKGFQCCKTIVNNAQICNPMVKPIISAINESATENGKKLTREYIGYSMFKDSQSYISYNFECPDGKFSFKYESKNYTAYEKGNLTSPKHCLKYYNDNKEITGKDICFNATIAQNGTGVSCGFYEFDIKMNNNFTVKYKTCFLYNDDIRKTKNLGYLIKQMAEDVAVRESINKERVLQNYIMKGTNKQGKYFIYESLNDTVSSSKDSDGSSGANGANGAKFLKNRFKLLLILFYIFNF